MELLKRTVRALPVKWSGPKNRRHGSDRNILLSVAALIAVGVIVQYAIGQAIGLQAGVSENHFIIRHMISLVVGLFAFVAAWKIPIKFWISLAPVMIVGGLLASILPIIIDGTGSRWIQIGFFSFQPVEVIKMGFILWSAVYIADSKLERGKSSANMERLQPLMVLLAVTTFLIVVLQKDLGSMAVIAVSLLAMLWVGGFSIKSFAGLLVVVLVGLGLFVNSEQYRRDRFTTFLNPSADCSGEGFQACQALIGVGSGGLFGRGVGESVQVYGYLPEANNDSVFAIFAEIGGFVGVAVLFAIIYRLYSSMYLTAKSIDPVGRLIIVGIMGWLAFQTMLNIGAMIGLLPLKGITLPFISYGGSSLLMTLFASGIVLQLSSYTMYTHAKNRQTTHSSMRGRVRRPSHSAARG